MSFWSDAKKAVRKAAKKAAEAASTVVNTVSEVVSDAAETVSNAVESGLNTVAGAASNIPGVGGALSTFVRWNARIAGAAGDMVSAGIKASGGLLGGSMAGLIQIGVGTLTFDGAMIRDGYIEMSSGITGSIILFGGKTVALLQAAFPGVDQRRELTEEEKALLRRVFLDSVALHNVRMVDTKSGAGFLGMGTRPYALGNTIYLMGRNPSREPQLLVHECTHVWQYQNKGSSYSSDALGAQATVPDPYSWEREISRGNDQWTQFNNEAQAAFMEDIYTHGQLTTFTPVFTGNVLVPTGLSISQPGSGVFYDAEGYRDTPSGPVVTVGQFTFNKTDHTVRANKAVGVVRNDFNARLSGAFD